jgi:hypothetical protein
MYDDQRAQREREIVALIRETPGEWSEIRVHVCANVTTTQLLIS